MAGEGMSLPPEALQLLLSSALGPQGKAVNNMDSLFALMMSPEFSAFTGLADPIGGQSGPQPAAYGTITQRYLESADVALADIANGIVAGAYRTPEEAKAKLRAYVADASTGTTVTSDQVDSVVDSIFTDYVSHQDDIAKWQQDQQTVWQKYGLPDPTDQYYAGTDASGQFSTNMPLDGPLGQEFASRERNLALAQMDMQDFLKKNPSYRTPEQRKTSSSDVKALEKAQAELQKQKSGDTQPSTYTDPLGNQRQGQDPNAVPSGMYRDPMSGKVLPMPQDPPNTHRDPLGNLVSGPAPTDPPNTYRDPLGNVRQGTDPNAVPDGMYEDPMTGELRPIPNSVPRDGLSNQTGEAQATPDNTAAIWTGRGLQEAQRNAAAAPSAEGDAMFNDLTRKLIMLRGSQARAEAQALFTRNQGQSPLTDALMARFMAARQMGLTG